MEDQTPQDGDTPMPDQGVSQTPHRLRAFTYDGVAYDHGIDEELHGTWINHRGHFKQQFDPEMHPPTPVELTAQELDRTDGSMALAGLWIGMYLPATAKVKHDFGFKGPGGGVRRKGISIRDDDSPATYPQDLSSAYKVIVSNSGSKVTTYILHSQDKGLAFISKIQKKFVFFFKGFRADNDTSTTTSNREQIWDNFVRSETKAQVEVATALHTAAPIVWQDDLFNESRLLLATFEHTADGKYLKALIERVQAVVSDTEMGSETSNMMLYRLMDTGTRTRFEKEEAELAVRELENLYPDLTEFSVTPDDLLLLRRGLKLADMGPPKGMHIRPFIVDFVDRARFLCSSEIDGLAPGEPHITMDLDEAQLRDLVEASLKHVNLQWGNTHHACLQVSKEHTEEFLRTVLEALKCIVGKSKQRSQDRLASLGPQVNVESIDELIDAFKKSPDVSSLKFLIKQLQRFETVQAIYAERDTLAAIEELIGAVNEFLGLVNPAGDGSNDE